MGALKSVGERSASRRVKWGRERGRWAGERAGGRAKKADWGWRGRSVRNISERVWGEGMRRAEGQAERRRRRRASEVERVSTRKERSEGKMNSREHLHIPVEGSLGDDVVCSREGGRGRGGEGRGSAPSFSLMMAPKSLVSSTSVYRGLSTQLHHSTPPLPSHPIPSHPIRLPSLRCAVLPPLPPSPDLGEEKPTHNAQNNSQKPTSTTFPPSLWSTPAVFVVRPVPRARR